VRNRGQQRAGGDEAPLDALFQVASSRASAGAGHFPFHVALLQACADLGNRTPVGGSRQASVYRLPAAINIPLSPCEPGMTVLPLGEGFRISSSAYDAGCVRWHAILASFSRVHVIDDNQQQSGLTERRQATGEAAR